MNPETPISLFSLYTFASLCKESRQVYSAEYVCEWLYYTYLEYIKIPILIYRARKAFGEDPVE